MFIVGVELKLSVLLKELQECKAKYSMLGVFLGLKPELIHEFEAFRGDSEGCLLELLDIYVRDKSPNMEEVCEAVDQVGHANLSKDLRKKYRGIEV